MTDPALDAGALEAAKLCLGDAIAWGCEPSDALGSAIVQYLSALPGHAADEVGRLCERLEFHARDLEMNDFPKASASIREAAAILQSQAAELAEANERVTAAVDDYNDVLARAARQAGGDHER